MRVLAGDIGGTKTLLAVLDQRPDGRFEEVVRQRYVSADHPGLGPIVRDFLARADVPDITRAGFGVAGPVVDRRSRVTNLPWQIDADLLAAELGLQSVALINDFAAVALGLQVLSPADLEVLQAGERDPSGPIALIGAGTGLGEAVLVPTPAGPRFVASEGGHCDLAPRNELEIALLRFLLKQHHRVSYERIVSGPGLVTAYQFVVAEGLAPELSDTRERMATEDPGAVIGARALAGDDPACVRAVDIFLDLYGAEAGNLALKVLPTGGLFVAGGIAGKLLPRLRDGRFITAFTDKGRMSPLLRAMHVAVVKNADVGLLGAGLAGLG
ncbi:glucokinase [Nannocystis bainbridge]|uniref:Glucokinase n=1 Tax=Nannocystis bainbridge TaxID=2995303 RepID=A0ABT5E2G6_9BACT|nr:glucokinase [Nannocystis bainbridge]MDC0720067.1 glucokinase [Nannocystis bainbridge]